jgi:hypothetical protein
MKVMVYWNLHKGMWSVKALEGPDKGRVIARVPEIVLGNPEGKVSEAGRQRVLREDRKNVHAGIVGVTPVSVWQFGEEHRNAVMSIGDTITYNPRKYTSFVHTVDESPFEGAWWAVFTADRQVFVA